MPYVYVHQCDSCQFDVETAVSREFYRQADGTPADYHYPDPGLYEWPPKRVAGLWSHLWCDHCRALREWVLVELDEPAEHPVQAFLAAEARGLTGAETGPCPLCRTPLRVELGGVRCPSCETGTLECVGEYEP